MYKSIAYSSTSKQDDTEVPVICKYYKYIMWKFMILSLITTAALGDVLMSGVFAFEWISSSLFPNGTVVQACVGDNVTFPWDFDMKSPRQVSIEWIKTSEDHHKRKVRAAYTGDKFSQLQVERELEFLPKAGIMLPEVTLEDTGYYIVEILLHGDPQLYKQGAFLHVSDIPVTTSDELHAFILPERIYNSTTGQWHVQLGCRPPVIQGQPALPVIWMTPSYRTVLSTSYNNNTFMLRLPNPIEEGDYSCSLNTSVLSVKCLSTQLDISHAATVHVKGDNNARLSNVEGNVETLWKVTNNLNDSVCQLSDLVQNIQASHQRCCEVVENVNDTTNNFQNETELLTTVMNIIRKENNNATRTIFELQTKNEEIITRVIGLENTTSVTAKALGHLQNKYDIITSAIQSMHDNLTDMDQSNFDKITSMVQSEHDNITVQINETFENMEDLKIKNENLTRALEILQRKYDNVAAQNLQLESKFDNLTAKNIKSESKYDMVITRLLQLESRCDNVTVQHFQLASRYDNVTAKDLQLESKYDNVTAKYLLLESKYNNATAKYVKLESKYDNATARILKLESDYNKVTVQHFRLESNYDNVTAKYLQMKSMYDNITDKYLQLVSKYDNVTAKYLQLESHVMYLHKDDREKKPASCDDVKKYDKMSGPHTLFLSDNKTVKVYCDQTTDNGGWTVIQRRQDGSVDFYRNWEQYERGFGDLNTEFWIGLTNLNYLTKAKHFKLRVDLMDFNGSSAYAVYNTFNISGSEDNYRLNVGGYTGTAGDGLTNHNMMLFSTYDRDHDTNTDGNCAREWQGGWWYNACAYSNLNGRYRSDGSNGGQFVTWYYWKSDMESLKRVEMKIKQ